MMILHINWPEKKGQTGPISASINGLHCMRKGNLVSLVNARHCICKYFFSVSHWVRVWYRYTIHEALWGDQIFSENVTKPPVKNRRILLIWICICYHYCHYLWFDTVTIHLWLHYNY